MIFALHFVTVPIITQIYKVYTFSQIRTYIVSFFSHDKDTTLSVLRSKIIILSNSMQ